MLRSWRVSVGLALGAVAILGIAWAGWMKPSRPRESLSIVVMDPLARPLACACVGGYAQRDYDALAAFLSTRLHRPFRVVYAESLERALNGVDKKQVAAVIGKESVVEHDAGPLGLTALARLTDKEGAVTLTGLFIVRTNDTATTLKDLADHEVLFGTPESAEKRAAALDALAEAGVAVGKDIQARAGCSEAAMEVLESTNRRPVAAVISSYALPLLEGCGSIPPGSFRVIGRTRPVPFITVFATGNLSAKEQRELRSALEEAGGQPGLLKALESQGGFEPLAIAGEGWADWRGPGRRAQVAWLPSKLPPTLEPVWKYALEEAGMGGVAASEGRTIVGDRDSAAGKDVFRCLNAETGALLWEFSYPAPGKLDYGASPRATPLVTDGRVYLLGAFGDLHCVELSNGRLCWRRHLSRDFNATRPNWGYCCTPLLVDDSVIVNPGNASASIVALDRRTGRVAWKTPGAPAAYAPFICGNFGGRRQIIGYDAESVGGWDPGTGKRLWRLVPPNPGDFNVPTPIAWNGHLILCSENNGTRLYTFGPGGIINPEPVAANPDLSPGTGSGAVAGATLVGIGSGLVMLKMPSLETAWRGDPEGFGDHASLFATPGKLLALTFDGQLCLFSTDANELQLVSRLRVFEPESETYAHPAICGSRIYLRDQRSVFCLELGKTGVEP